MGDGKVVVKKGEFAGSIWFIGWLFSIGFCQLSFGKAVLAIVIWPYYLGRILSALGG